MAGPSWEAHLSAGPYDGARVTLDVDEDALPHEVVMSFATGDDAAHPAWHTYVLDATRHSFRYLGEDLLERLLDDDGDPDPVTGRIHDHALTVRCYELLFERHPDLRAMFPTDIRPQAAMLQATLRAVLAHLDDPDWMTNILEQLGREHTARGVTPEMYAAFVDCMLTAMGELSGRDWSDTVEDDWRETLEDITTRMSSSD